MEYTQRRRHSAHGDFAAAGTLMDMVMAFPFHISFFHLDADERERKENRIHGANLFELNSPFYAV